MLRTKLTTTSRAPVSCSRVGMITSRHNALDLVEADLVVAPVVEAGGPCAFVVGHLLRHFELAPVLQVLGDACRPKRVIADFGEDACCRSAAPDHPVGIRLAHRPLVELARASGRGTKEIAVAISPEWPLTG